MSVNGRFTCRTKDAGHLVRAISVLLEHGWELSPGGAWVLPLNARDSSEWQQMDLDRTELLALLGARLDRNVTFGVRLLWQASSTGGEFLGMKPDLLCFSPSLERRTIANRITDASWYLERLAVPLVSTRTTNSWAWQETGL